MFFSHREYVIDNIFQAKYLHHKYFTKLKKDIEESKRHHIHGASW